MKALIRSFINSRHLSRLFFILFIIYSPFSYSVTWWENPTFNIQEQSAYDACLAFRSYAYNPFQPYVGQQVWDETLISNQCQTNVGTITITHYCGVTLGQVSTVYDPSNPLCRFEPPVECEPDDTLHPEDFYYADTTLDAMDDNFPDEFCDGPDGASGCNYMLDGFGACIPFEGGISCAGNYKMTGVCGLTEPSPDITDKNTAKNTTNPDTSSSPVNIKPDKKGNCATYDGVETCFPLAEGKQSGKDLLIAPLPSDQVAGTDTPVGTNTGKKIPQNQLDQIEKVAVIMTGNNSYSGGGNGQHAVVYNNTVNNSSPVIGDFDNGSGVGSGSGGGSSAGGSSVIDSNTGTDSGGGTSGGQDTGTTNDLLKDIKDSLDGDATIPDKGTFNTDNLDSEIQTLKQQIKTQFQTIRTQVSQLYSSNATGTGSLYCQRDIPINLGVTSTSFDICFQDYADKLGIIGTMILALSLILSVYIVLKD